MSMAEDTIHFTGFDNYIGVLTNKQFLDSALWTFNLSISAVALNVILGMALHCFLHLDIVKEFQKYVRRFLLCR